MDKLNILWLSD